MHFLSPSPVRWMESSVSMSCSQYIFAIIRDAVVVALDTGYELSFIQLTFIPLGTLIDGYPVQPFVKFNGSF